MIKTLFIVAFCVIFSQAEIKPEALVLKKTLSSNIIVEFVFSDALLQDKVLTVLNLEKLDSIISNLIFFEQEIENSYFLKNAEYKIFFDSNQDVLNNLSIFVSHPALKIDREYRINRVEFDKKFRVVNICMNRKNKNDEMIIHDIYNIAFDEKGNILKRIVIRSSNDSLFSAIEKGEKFIDGKTIEYKQFNNYKMPASYKISTFIFSKKGKMINVNVKESLNRTFNEQGLLTGESVRETKYSYSNDKSNYSIYNVKFFNHGKLKRYDLVFSNNDQNIFEQAENYEFEFLKYNIDELLVSKSVKKFYLENRRKIYVDGKELFLKWNVFKKLISSKEKYYIFKNDDNSDMLKKIYTKASYNDNIIYNDKQQVSSEHIIQTVFNPSIDGQLEYIESFREVNYSYKAKDISNIKVIFFDFNKSYQKIKLREISIDILELMKNKEPAIIKVVINDNGSENGFEQTIIQDCSYTINEAIYGELFTLPLKNRETTLSMVSH